MKNEFSCLVRGTWAEFLCTDGRPFLLRSCGVLWSHLHSLSLFGGSKAGRPVPCLPAGCPAMCGVCGHGPGYCRLPTANSMFWFPCVVLFPDTAYTHVDQETNKKSLIDTNYHSQNRRLVKCEFLSVQMEVVTGRW